MANLVNPKAKVKVFGTLDFEITDLHMEFDISKDLDEEPNEAEVTIYNLGADTRGKLSDNANQLAPIEIYLSPAGIDEYVLAFRGEIESVIHERLKPGHRTMLGCTSQKQHHYSFFVDQKTFAKGTPHGEILKFFIDTLSLPKGSFVLPPESLLPDPILQSRSYSGPAYLLIKQVAHDAGLFAYILDGVLYISDVYDPPSVTTKSIDKTILLEPPIATKQSVPQWIECKSVAESNKLIAKAKRASRKTREAKIVAASGYRDYTSTDETMTGMDFECLMQPDIQPDNIITTNLEGFDGRLFRVIEVNHFGDTSTFDDWTTRITTYDYEGA